ncbi:hypothetical protein IJH72_00660 [Candidatus Saccharibacteria bacterium]|nr:hypothetical protein [Candidatus Saccharibacteria bacterium]
MAGSGVWLSTAGTLVRAGVELHGTAILGMLEARKDFEDGDTFFNMENQCQRNSIYKEKKPEKKLIC